jgi:hypothetical protein
MNNGNDINEKLILKENGFPEALARGIFLRNKNETPTLYYRFGYFSFFIASCLFSPTFFL